MSGIKIKKKDWGPQVSRTKASRVVRGLPTSKKNRLSHPGSLDPDPGAPSTLTADLDSVLRANEEAANDPRRLWCLKLIFAHRLGADEEPTRNKQVGYFLVRPVGFSAQQVESALLLPKAHQIGQRLNEIKSQVSNVVGKEVFTIDCDAPQGAHRVTPDRLFQFVCKQWESPPVNTMGYVELFYQHCTVILQRRDMAQESGRDHFYREIGNVLMLMDKGFFWDPESRSLRRKGWGLELV